MDLGLSSYPSTTKFILKSVEKVSPGIGEKWEKNQRELDQNASASRPAPEDRSSKFVTGIIDCAIVLGATAKTRQEALAIANKATAIMAEADTMVSSKKEENLGVALASMYNEVGRRIGLTNPSSPKIDERLVRTAEVLADAYKSPTCSSSVRAEIDKADLAATTGQLLSEKIFPPGGSIPEQTTLDQDPVDNQRPTPPPPSKNSEDLKSVSSIISRLRQPEPSSRTTQKLLGKGLKEGTRTTLDNENSPPLTRRKCQKQVI
jgi:hypothetical protein